jgi:hypothetical protein
VGLVAGDLDGRADHDAVERRDEMDREAHATGTVSAG